MQDPLLFETITGRKIRLSELENEERRFIAIVVGRLERLPEWREFSSWWREEFARSSMGSRSIVRRICEDLELRLGIAEGAVPFPSLRDHLADLIDERFGSRYRFCKETGIDPGHLSRVFSGQSQMSIQKLEQILSAMSASIVIRLEADRDPLHTPADALRVLSAAAR